MTMGIFIFHPVPSRCALLDARNFENVKTKNRNERIIVSIQGMANEGGKLRALVPSPTLLKRVLKIFFDLSLGSLGFSDESIAPREIVQKLHTPGRPFAAIRR